jgi:hypothetical protein
MTEGLGQAIRLPGPPLWQEDEPLAARLVEWVRTELVWYAGSFTIHLLALSVLLLMGNFAPTARVDNAPSFDAPEAERTPSDKIPDLGPLVIGEPEESQPTEIDLTAMPITPPAAPGDGDAAGDTSPTSDPGHPSAGTGSSDGGGLNPLATVGTGTFGPPVSRPGPGPGPQGGQNSFGPRGNHSVGGKGGPTKPSERAVAGALVWLVRHQLADGSWSLGNYVQRCSDKTCTGPGNIDADPGATALGLLPFLAAGQTHRTGPNKAAVAKGLAWLIRHQQPDGYLAKGCTQPMYSHGLATIALCEAFGMTGDKTVGYAAQGAVNFIMKAQNPATGGWRYNPGDDGDTSVLGWQLMALKSAHMAGLSVGGSIFGGTSKWLDACQHGVNHSEYGYRPDIGPSPTMTAVGLLCRQYLGAARDCPMLHDGVQYLMQLQPDPRAPPNVYYFYYASQVMHNMSGPDWDTWNRRMRKLLVDTQQRDPRTCANGSWDPATDPWGKQGGRLMVTSLSALTLEIYYRYLPLYKP